MRALMFPSGSVRLLVFFTKARFMCLTAVIFQTFFEDLTQLYLLFYIICHYHFYVIRHRSFK